MKIIVKLFMAVMITTVIVCPAFGEDTFKIKKGSLEIKVNSVYSTNKYIFVYCCLKNPDVIPAICDKNCNIIFPAQEYHGKKISPRNQEVLLTFKCNIKNISDAIQSFRFDDLFIRDSMRESHFMIIGLEGRFIDETDNNILEKKVFQLDPHTQIGLQIEYVFSVPMDSSSWRLTSKDNESIELKSKAQEWPIKYE